MDGREARNRPGTAVRALAAWAHRPSGRLALPGLLILVLVGLTGTAGAYLVPAASRSAPTGPSVAQQPSTDPVPTTQAPIPPAPPPTLLPTPSGQASPGRPSDVLAGWAQQMSAKTQIPPIAMQAYGYAEWVLSQQQPGCHLSWTTLAAIGKVESNHGSAGSATLTPDGRAYPPIYGDPLDGLGGRRLIRDTDGGNLDKDTGYDRAIGPMQFIPQSWLQYQVDADDDGVKDPHDVDDAALAAAGYLCAGSRDLATTNGWWQAVLAYNAVQPYAEAVFTAANDYGRLSLGTQ